MSDFGEIGIGKKRKADFALMDEEQREVSKKQPESFLATEEELKKRRIVKVIRGGNTIDNQNEEAPKGRFSFLNSGDGTQNKEIKTTDSQKKINVTTSTIRFNPPEKQTENQITEKINPIANNLSERKIEKVGEEASQINNEESKVSASLKKQEVNTFKMDVGHVVPGEQLETKQPVYYTGNVEKKFNFGGTSSSGTDNTFQNTSNLQSKSPFINISTTATFNSNLINSNPFVSRETANNFTTSTNPFAPSNQSNRFASSLNNIVPSTFKSSINFNLTSASANPNWESDEEDGDGVNPEEEVKISGTSGSNLQSVEVNPNLVKFFKINVQDLSEYNFEAKKYQSKGKGDVSIELTRMANNTIAAMCAFRNNALKILFQGSVIASVTNLNINNKNYKYIIVIQKLFSINESTNKPEAKSVKLEFNTENDFNMFKNMFENVVVILQNKDLSVFPVKEGVIISEKADEKPAKSGEKNKSEVMLHSENKSKHK